MAEGKKTCIYYNNNYYYDFHKVISANDRGLQFGDGCYEWVRIHNGHTFALSYHTDRLYRSMRLLGIRPTVAPEDFAEIAEVLIEETGLKDGYLKIIVTRGDGDHEFTIPSRNKLRPNVLMYVAPIDLEKIAEIQKGVDCITMKDNRGPHCNILSLNQLDNMMDRAEAQKKGCYEAIFTRDNLVLDATHSNVCIVKAGVIWMPPVRDDLLHGITRSLVLRRVAPTAGITAIDDSVEPITLDTLKEAEEVFLTNPEDGIIPVLHIDGEQVGDGKVGPVTAQIQDHYAKLMRDGLR